MEFYQILGFFFVYSTILFFVQYFGNASSSSHYVNSVQRRSFFWSVFSRIQFEYWKIRTRKSSVFGHFSRNAIIVFKEILSGTANAFPYSRIIRIDMASNHERYRH